MVCRFGVVGWLHQPSRVRDFELERERDFHKRAFLDRVVFIPYTVADRGANETHGQSKCHLRMAGVTLNRMLSRVCLPPTHRVFVYSQGAPGSLVIAEEAFFIIFLRVRVRPW